MSNKRNKQDKTPSTDVEYAALYAAGAVIIFFVLYWALQIRAVLDLLRLAYGDAS